MQDEKKSSTLFRTKTIYYPPLQKRVNILLQRNDGPCMLVAIFNSLVLKGKVKIEKNTYSASEIIDVIRSYDSGVHGLSKVVHGFYVNPSFESVTSFEEYPAFLRKLNIQMVHAMTPCKSQKHYEIITHHNYDSLQLRLVELESINSKEDEIKVLQSWNRKIQKQLTNAGINEVESTLNEGDVCIFFRNSHFAVITKYRGQCYSLITCRGLGGQTASWHSLPSISGDFQYFDERFNITYCNPWEEAQVTEKKSQNDSTKVSKKHRKASKKSGCTIA